MDRFSPTRKVSKKLKSTFWGGPLFPVGPVGNFGWMDHAHVTQLMGEPFYSRKEIEEWILHEHENLSKRQNCYYARQNELGKLRSKYPRHFRKVEQKYFNK